MMLGRILNRFTKDIDIIDEYIPWTLFDFLQVDWSSARRRPFNAFSVSFPSLRRHCSRQLAQSMVVHSSTTGCDQYVTSSKSICSMFERSETTGESHSKSNLFVLDFDDRWIESDSILQGRTDLLDGILFAFECEHPGKFLVYYDQSMDRLSIRLDYYGLHCRDHNAGPGRPSHRSKLFHCWYRSDPFL